MRKEILGLKLWQLDSTNGGFEKVKEVFFFFNRLILEVFVEGRRCGGSETCGKTTL